MSRGIQANTRRSSQRVTRRRRLIVDRFGYDATLVVIDNGYQFSGIGRSRFGLPSNVLPIQTNVVNGYWGTNMTPTDPLAAINQQLVI